MAFSAPGMGGGTSVKRTKLGGRYANGAVGGNVTYLGKRRDSAEQERDSDIDVSRYYDEESQVPAYDLTLVKKNSSAWKGANGPKASNDPGKIEVIAHGCDNGKCLYDRRGRTLNVDKVEALIRKYTDFEANPRPIELNVCFSGKGSNSLAEQLSLRFGQPVSGPTTEGLIYDDGRYDVKSPGHQRTFPESTEQKP